VYEDSGFLMQKENDKTPPKGRVSNFKFMFPELVQLFRDHLVINLSFMVRKGKH